MQRFYVDKSCINDSSVIINGDDANHISKVLRLNIGDEIIVCDGFMTDLFCEIESISKNEVTLKILKIDKNLNEPPINITLYQGLPKSDKLEYIIQKTVELGVSNIVPVSTKRCVVKIKDDAKKLLRWQKIADEASKQCGRGKLTKVSNVMTFCDAINHCQDNDLKIIPYENERENNLKSILSTSSAKNIAIFIGPEGGFDDEEIDLAIENSIKPITLGPRILRTETAPIAVISACMYELGDW